MPVRNSGKKSPLPNAKDSSLYLRKNLENVLPRALHDVCQARPADPIEYLAKCLYKAADTDLYFQDKAVFEKEKRKMELKMKTEDTTRQNAIERYKKHIADIKSYILREEAKRQAAMGVPTKQADRKQRYQLASGKRDSRGTKSLFEDYRSELSSELSSSRHGSESLSSVSSFTETPKPGASRRQSVATPKTPESRKSPKRASLTPTTPQPGTPVRRPSAAPTMPGPEASLKKTSIVGAPRLKHSTARRGSTPSTETRSVVSMQRESLSTSRTLHDDELERSPMTPTSSSKTVSRLFSFAQDVIKQPSDKKSKRSKHVTQQDKKARSESRSSQYKTDQDQSETGLRPPQATWSKQMKWKRGDALSESSSYVSLDDRGAAWPDLTEAVSSRDVLRKISSRKVKIRTKKAERDESDTSVRDASDIEIIHGSQKESKESIASEIRKASIESDLISLGGQTISSSKVSSLASLLDEKSKSKIAQSFEDLQVKDSRLDHSVSKDVISTEQLVRDEVRKESSSGKKTKKVKVKSQVSKVTSKIQVSKVMSKIDGFKEPKSPKESEELEQPGTDSGQKRKKKKRIKTQVVKSADEEDMEYGEESRRPTIERSSSHVELLEADETTEELSTEEQQVVPVDRKRAKKKRVAITIDIPDDEDVVIELDGEIISKQTGQDADTAGESSEPKRRTRRRVKRYDSKATDDEDDYQDDQDEPRSRYPSAEPSSVELYPKSLSKLSVKKGKAYGRRKSFSRDRRSFVDITNRMSSEDPLGLATEYSDARDQSTDLLDSTFLPLDLEQQGTELTSAPEMTEEPETFPFTPVECEWFLIGSQTLVCRHPVLGDIRSRPVTIAQSFFGWPDRLTYNWRAFYDPEIYTVIEPFTSETKNRRKTRDL